MGGNALGISAAFHSMLVRQATAYQLPSTLTGMSASSLLEKTRNRRVVGTPVAGEYFRISMMCVNRWKMSSHPLSRFWCHSSELLQLLSWLFIPVGAFVVYR